MTCYSGQVWNGEGFSEGYVVVEGGRIVETGEGIPSDSVCVGYIMPGLTDSHTHIGDAGLRLDRRYSLEELVAPPDGLKHRYLRDTPPDRIEKDSDIERLAVQYAAEEESAGKAFENGIIDKVIAPENTRSAVSAALDMLAPKRVTNVSRKHGNMPY